MAHLLSRLAISNGNLKSKKRANSVITDIDHAKVKAWNKTLAAEIERKSTHYLKNHRLRQRKLNNPGFWHVILSERSE